MKTVKLFVSGELIGTQAVTAETAEKAIIAAVAMFPARGIDYAVCENCEAVV